MHDTALHAGQRESTLSERLASLAERVLITSTFIVVVLLSFAILGGEQDEPKREFTTGGTLPPPVVERVPEHQVEFVIIWKDGKNSQYRFLNMQECRDALNRATTLDNLGMRFCRSRTKEEK